MKLNNRIGTLHGYRRIALAATLATAALLTAACSTNKPAQKVEAAQPTQAVVKPASLAMSINSSVPAKAVDAKPVDKTDVKQPASKLLRYKSRDYSVSFEYPWQYSFVNARKIAENEALQPKPDGDDGQITLARIDVPKGFYPDTDFESGYFALGLNPELDEHGCKAALDADKHGGVQKSTINGTDFFWVESEQGGKGSTSKVRNYVAFANDACYEVELGVKTRNEEGLATEVNAEHVMRRLDGILQTVTIDGSKAKPAANDVQSSLEQPKSEGQK